MLQQFLYRNKLYSQVYRNTEQLWETYFAIQSNYNQILHFQQTAMVFFNFYARKTQSATYSIYDLIMYFLFFLIYYVDIDNWELKAPSLY